MIFLTKLAVLDGLGMQRQPSAATTTTSCTQSPLLSKEIDNGESIADEMKHIQPTKQPNEGIWTNDFSDVNKRIVCGSGCMGDSVSLLPRKSLSRLMYSYASASLENGLVSSSPLLSSGGTHAARAPWEMCMTLDEQLEDMIGEHVKLYKDDGSFLVRGALLREGQRFCKPNADGNIKERWEVVGQEGTAVFEWEVVKAIDLKTSAIMLGLQFNHGEEYKQG